MSAFDDLIADYSTDLDHYFGEVTESIIYRRGTDAIELVATPHAANNMADAEYGIIIPENFMRFLLHRGDFIIQGTLNVPEVGDIIERTVGDYTKRYRVTVPPGGQNCYRIDAQEEFLTVFAVEL